MRTHIQEIIVVEGKNDTNTLQRYFDCDTIETGGDQVNQKTIDRIAKAQKTRGVIIFTDPDTPGEHIRRIINQNVPDCKNAFIPKDKAKTPKKVGVEHARKEDLWHALEHCVTFSNYQQSLSWEEFIDLGLVGDARYRYTICEKLFIGPCNGKTCFKRLNQMNVHKEDILKLLKEESYE
ncbi:MAG: ribonuclease M5 [Holdemanella sp.]|nr:ribonuclease M5 [Holdemanella sp.]